MVVNPLAGECLADNHQRPNNREAMRGDIPGCIVDSDRGSQLGGRKQCMTSSGFLILAVPARERRWCYPRHPKLPQPGHQSRLTPATSCPPSERRRLPLL